MNGNKPSQHMRFVCLGFVGLAIAVTIVASIATLVFLVPTPRGATSWRNPVSVDEALRTQAYESRWPMVWIGEICDGPLYQLRGVPQLRHATYAAACQSKAKPSTSLSPAMRTTPSYSRICTMRAIRSTS